MGGRTVSTPAVGGRASAGPARARRRPARLRSAALSTLLALLAAAPPVVAGKTTAAARAADTPPEVSARDPGPADREGRKHVLLLYAEPRLLPGLVIVDEVIRSTLQARSPGPVHFYTEYLDLSLLTGRATQREVRDLLRRKYARIPLDLVIAGGGEALRFALEHRAELFRQVPIVFSAVDRSAAARLALDAGVTGVWVTLDWAETLDVALRLQPGTKRAVVVGGTSGTDALWLAAAREQLAAYRDRLEIEYLVDRPLAEILKRVAALPDQTVVLLGAFLRDATGHDVISREAIAAIAAASRVPAYGLSDTYVGAGVVGGRVVRFEAIGASLAGLGLRALRGERAGPPVVGASVPMFDWRQLQRWRLDAARLPPGSVVRFSPPPAWELYRRYIVGALALFVLQSALIAALLVQRARRRRAQRALAERLRFETLLSELSTAFVPLPPSGLDGEVEHWLRRFGEDLGIDQASLLEINAEGDRVRFTHSWTRPGSEPVPREVATGGFPWVSTRLLGGDVVCFSRPRDLPDGAAIDRQNFVALGTRSLVVVPLRRDGAVTGALSFATIRAERDWPAELVQRLRLVGDVFANALARRQAESAARESEERQRASEEALQLSHARVRELAGRLITAQEEERRRLSRDLHDDLNQKIAALALDISHLQRLVAPAEGLLRDGLTRLHGVAASLADHVRRLSHDLHPAVLELAGLAAALRGFCAEFRGATEVDVTLDLPPSLDALPDDVALCLFRVAQEALRNVAQHADARRAEVVVRVDHDAVTLTVRDAGVGFDVASLGQGRGLGVVSMDERVRLVGGTVTIRSAPGAGTEVAVVVPLPRAAAAANLG